MKSPNLIAGIDFGSKLSGLTVIAWLQPESLEVKWKRSVKGKSADDFLQEIIYRLKPYIIGIDAPLSLPGRYLNPSCYDDYFYRKADREAGAMSPMFIGGLTARAIRIRDEIKDKTGATVAEVYPKLLAGEWGLNDAGYKQKGGNLPDALQLVINQTGWILPDDEPTWHHVDALLALASTIRLSRNEAVLIGEREEGLIAY